MLTIPLFCLVKSNFWLDKSFLKNDELLEFLFQDFVDWSTFCLLLFGCYTFQSSLSRGPFSGEILEPLNENWRLGIHFSAKVWCEQQIQWNPATVAIFLSQKRARKSSGQFFIQCTIFPHSMVVFPWKCWAIIYGHSNQIIPILHLYPLGVWPFITFLPQGQGDFLKIPWYVTT